MNDLAGVANVKLIEFRASDELATARPDASPELTRSESASAEIVAPSEGQSAGRALPEGDPAASRESSDSTTTTNHRADGSFAPGNTAALKHGGRRSLDRPEALTAIAGKRAELIAHVGESASVIQHDIITDYARTDVLIESVAANIEVGGIFSSKGRTRAAVTLLLSLMERRLRLAQALGLERRAKRVPSLSEVMQDDHDARE
jgi:hypothetical protein